MTSSRHRPAGGAYDYQLLLTVIAGISLAVAATALPPLIEGPFHTWTYAARLVLWFAGIAAVVLEYLAVLFGSRLYLRRVEVFATTSLILVFLAQAGMFTVLYMSPGELGPRWFVLFALFNLFSAIEAAHGRRMVLRHARPEFGDEVVTLYAASLRQVVLIVSATAVASLLFAVIGHDAPHAVVFVAGFVALVVMLVANVQQYRIRTRLYGDDAWEDVGTLSQDGSEAGEENDTEPGPLTPR